MKKLFLLIVTAGLFLQLSAQQIEYNYKCPVPGSMYINPEQTVILKTGYPFDPGTLHEAFASLHGSITGPIGAYLSLSQDHYTLFVHSLKRFALGETIHVFVSPGLTTFEGKEIASVHFEFDIKESIVLPLASYPENLEEMTVGQAENKAGEKATYIGRDNNLPEDYPAPASVYTGEGVSDGYTFATPSVRMAPQYGEYLTIWDNYGIPVYYQKKDYTVFDLKVVDDGILAFAKGANQNAALKRYYFMDATYTIIDSVLAGNGYYIDNHDIEPLENGHYLIICYDPQVVNMSLIVEGGDPAAVVTGLVLQEVDNQQNVYFQWRSWDHFQITDATDDISLTAHQIDYVHANAVDIDSDGNILLSSRHLDEITKIDFATGDVIWRFGLNSENNQFTILNDPVGFSHQHDINKLDNGHYMLFNNGNLLSSQISRGMEYDINEQTMVATLIWNYQHMPSIYASSTGSSRRLENGNTLIGWGGSTPIGLTEVNTANETVFEITMPDNVAQYRILKFPWSTTLFTSQNDIGFGNCLTGSPKEYFLQVMNNSSQVIHITSVHNHYPEYFYVENLPLTIFPGMSSQLHVYFQPGQDGDYHDILTMNYDNYDNSRRIARQVKLFGLREPDLTSLEFDPPNGSVDVDPYGDIICTFSEPVKKVFGQELTDEDVPNIFYFKKSSIFGSTVSFHGTVSEDKTIITIIPDEPLDGDQQYYIQLISNKLADYQGNVIDYSDYCFFKTGELVTIDESASSEGVMIYPNPVQSILHIESSIESFQKIEVYSCDGRLIYSGRQAGRQANISSQAFPEGVLLVRAFLESGQTVSQQVIKFK